VQVRDNNGTDSVKAGVGNALEALAFHMNSELLRKAAATLRSTGSIDDFTIDMNDAPNRVEEDSGPVDMAAPIGLENIGNTCYLNSLLQYLFTVNAVRDIIENWDQYKLELTEENLARRRLGGSRVVLDRPQWVVGNARTCFTPVRRLLT
jgi:ubiquitin carboxyl-terminal hydrolase 25